MASWQPWHLADSLGLGTASSGASLALGGSGSVGVLVRWAACALEPTGVGAEFDAGALGGVGARCARVLSGRRCQRVDFGRTRGLGRRLRVSAWAPPACALGPSCRWVRCLVGVGLGGLAPSWRGRGLRCRHCRGSPSSVVGSHRGVAVLALLGGVGALAARAGGGAAGAVFFFVGPRHELGMQGSLWPSCALALSWGQLGHLGGTRGSC